MDYAVLEKITDAILNSNMLIEDIVIVNGHVFLKGKSKDFTRKENITLASTDMYDILSNSFVNSSDNNVSYEEKQKIYSKIINHLNMLIKLVSSLKDDVLVISDGKAYYVNPTVKVYIGSDLSTITNSILNNEPLSTEILVQKDGNIDLIKFDVNKNQLHFHKEDLEVWQLFDEKKEIK